MTPTPAHLEEIADSFNEKLARLKAENPLAGGLEWYRHDTIGGFDLLAKFLPAEYQDRVRLMAHGPVLDLCCADADLAFFLESLGLQVDAVDYPLTNQNYLRGAARMRELLDSAIGIHPLDLNFATTLPRPFYSTAYFFGGLYHLKNPYTPLELLSRHAHYCFLSTRIAHCTPDKRGAIHEWPLAYLVGPEELNGDWTNYWIFSEGGLRRILERTGWEIAAFTTFGNAIDSDPVHADADERAFCLLRSVPLKPYSGLTLTDGCHDLEEHGAWCWTRRQFRLTFNYPEPTATHLRLPVTIVEPMTVSVSHHGRILARQDFPTPGDHILTSPIPFGTATPMALDFEASHVLAASEQDGRELSLILQLWKSKEPRLVTA